MNCRAPFKISGIYIAKALFVVCFLIVPVLAQNSNSEDSENSTRKTDALERRIEENKKTLEQTRERQRDIVKQIDGTRTKERDLLNELHNTEQEVTRNADELELFENRLFETQRNLIMVQQDIDKLRESLSDYNNTLKKRLVSIYKRRQSGYSTFFLKSGSMMDFMKRFKLVRKIIRQDADAFADVREQYVRIKQKEKSLEEQREELEDYRKRLSEKKEELSQLEEQHRFLINEIRQRREKLEEEYSSVERSSTRITGIIDDLQSKKASLDSSKPVTLSPSEIRAQEQDEIKWRRALKMIWPVGSSKKVLKAFGRQKSEVNTMFDNKGLDIAANQGDPVKAATSGKVMYRGELRGYGQILIIDHGHGVNSLYAHLEDVLVRVNQEIQEGQEIATIGPPVADDGTSLHFEVRVDGEPNNPMNWLR